MPMTKIYLIRGGDLVKIGKANDVLARFSTLQGSSPVPLHLVGWMEADDAEERRLHKRFAVYQVRGEWFHWCPELEAFAALLQPPLSAEPAHRRHAERGITAGQLRMARAGLGLAAHDVAKAMRISSGTVGRAERDERKVNRATANSLRKAYERVGIEFLDDNGISFKKVMERYRKPASPSKAEA